MGVLGSTVVEDFKVSMCSRTARVNNPLRNTFMIKSMDFLSRKLIFEKRGTICRPIRDFQPGNQNDEKGVGITMYEL